MAWIQCFWAWAMGTYQVPAGSTTRRGLSPYGW